MREVRQLQTKLEEPTPTPSVAPSGNSIPLEWDPQALPQQDDIVSDTQPNLNDGDITDYRAISLGFGKYPEPQTTGDHARPV